MRHAFLKSLSFSRIYLSNRNLRLPLCFYSRKRCCVSTGCSLARKAVGCVRRIDLVDKPITNPALDSSCACISDSARVHINGHDPGSSKSHEKQNRAGRIQERICVAFDSPLDSWHEFAMQQISRPRLKAAAGRCSLYQPIGARYELPI